MLGGYIPHYIIPECFAFSGSLYGSNQKVTPKIFFAHKGTKTFYTDVIFLKYTILNICIQKYKTDTFYQILKLKSLNKQMIIVQFSIIY